MKEKKKEEVATLGYESSCTPNFSEKVRPLITGPCNHYAEYVSKLIAEVFFPATHTVWTLIYHEFKDTFEEKYLKRVSFKTISHSVSVFIHSRALYKPLD